MPVDPLSIALMAVNVGASVFNNWRNNKQSHKLQEKQQEFARAAAERNKQRMWQLMREGQELALEMERETHENRLEDIRNDFDKILHRFTFHFKSQLLSLAHKLPHTLFVSLGCSPGEFLLLLL